MNRAKMNSTMMVKFNSSSDKNPNANRGNLNKSTLLPSNFVSNRIGVNTGAADNLAQIGPAGPQSVGGNMRSSNATMPGANQQQLKLNSNLVGNNAVPPGGYSAMAEQNPNMFDANMQQASLDHLNRSMGVG